MSDQMLTTLQAALQQLASQQTAATLGDRSTYLGASDIGACPRKTILGGCIRQLWHQWHPERSTMKDHKNIQLEQKIL